MSGYPFSPKGYHKKKSCTIFTEMCIMFACKGLLKNLINPTYLFNTELMTFHNIGPSCIVDLKSCSLLIWTHLGTPYESQPVKN